MRYWGRLVAIGQLVSVLIGAAAVQAAPATPFAADTVHLGMATCAESTCHSADKPWQQSSVLQNEYLTWSQRDPHSGAHRVLGSEAARAIANRLGEDDPMRMDACLNCHANNVADERRGPRFAIEDGVTCEACHGGARDWLGTHVGGWATREDNLAAGMYPTEDPHARGRMCLGCHLGDALHPIDHAIYGAGHPRLRFELDTYTLAQPVHFRVDRDYELRKEPASALQTWAVGQALMAQLRTARVVEAFEGDALFPGMDVLNCYGCHRSMREGEGRSSVPMVDVANARMAAIAAGLFDAALERRIDERVDALERATMRSRADVVSAASALSTELDVLLERLRGAPLSNDQADGLLAGLKALAAGDAIADPHDAEQVLLAIALVADVQASRDLDAVAATLRKELYDQRGFDRNAFQRTVSDAGDE